MRKFADLTEREVLAVAISSEEEDSRIYMSVAEDLAERYPKSAKIFEGMAEEEKHHRHLLLEMYEQRFGPNLPPIRRQDVRGFLKRRPIWLTKICRSKSSARRRRQWSLRLSASIRKRQSKRRMSGYANCSVI
jgi:rubrerythrin